MTDKKRPALKRESKTEEPVKPSPSEAGLDLAYDLAKTDLTIERDALDEELVTFPSKIREVREHLIMAMSLRDETRLKQEEEEAAATLRVRAKLERQKEAGGKYTEPMVKELLKQDQGLMASKTRYKEANERVQRFENAVSAWEWRGRMLLKLCDMYMSDYFAPNAAKKSPTAAEARAGLAYQGRGPYRKKE